MRLRHRPPPPPSTDAPHSRRHPSQGVPVLDTLTFLFTDIEGSTRLEQAIGSVRYGELRERHRALIRAAFAAHGGEEQGTEGDSFFVVFRSARGALEAAVAGQRALGAEPWPGDAPVSVRMGLHSGEAAMSGGSLVGLDINRAARIAGAGHGGQIVASEATRALVLGALPAGVSLRSLGAHRLRDLREPEQLHQIVAADLRESFPPLRSIDARANNLPTQLTSFVGRERELADAGALLRRSRLVTLTGPGGTGKTRLSLQVAAEAADTYADGVFFVALETVRDPTLVIPRIAAAVGLAEIAGRSSRDLLVEWLGERRVLLVLDNFEQVLDGAPLVADLLRSAPALSVLATSRAALRVSGEQEYPVPGLPTPPDPSAEGGYARRLAGGSAAGLDPETLRTYEAVRLFIARAEEVRPGFAVTNDNAPAVAAICARLQGMPLAIELAAARVKLLTPDAILARLDHTLGLLAAGARDLPPRQQTLRGAIAWSYDLLDDGCRRLLDRLSVFAGGFELEAAEGVTGPSGELGVEVLDGVESLADQSLLRVADDGRFRMLDTIREFAAEMLEARGEADVILDRRDAWFLALAEGVAPALAGAGQRRHLDRLDLEHDNLRAVLDRGTARGDGEKAIRLGFALWRFWQKRGHLYEARRRLEAMAAAPWSQTVPVLRARLLEALGGVLWWQADLIAMRAAYTEAVEVWRRVGDAGEIANALYNFSFTFSVAPAGSPEGMDPDPDGLGRAALDEALALYRSAGDERGEANVLWGIGNRAYFRQEDPVPPLEAALTLFRRVGDVTMEAWSLHMLGGALVRVGRLDESREMLRDALIHFHDAGDAAGIALVLDDLASQAVADADLERAARLNGAARVLATATGATLAGFVDETFEANVRPHVRDRLSADELARLRAEGAAMSLEESVAYAFGGARPVH